MLRVVSLNLNGIRSAVNKGMLDWLAAQSASVVCLQELKAQAKDIVPEVQNPGKLLGYFDGHLGKVVYKIQGILYFMGNARGHLVE